MDRFLKFSSLEDIKSKMDSFQMMSGIKMNVMKKESSLQVIFKRCYSEHAFATTLRSRQFFTIADKMQKEVFKEKIKEYKKLESKPSKICINSYMYIPLDNNIFYEAVFNHCVINALYMIEGLFCEEKKRREGMDWKGWKHFEPKQDIGRLLNKITSSETAWEYDTFATLHINFAKKEKRFI